MLLQLFSDLNILKEKGSKNNLKHVLIQIYIKFPNNQICFHFSIFRIYAFRVIHYFIDYVYNRAEMVSVRVREPEPKPELGPETGSGSKGTFIYS